MDCGWGALKLTEAYSLTVLSQNTEFKASAGAVRQGLLQASLPSLWGLIDHLCCGRGLSPVSAHIAFSLCAGLVR